MDKNLNHLRFAVNHCVITMGDTIGKMKTRNIKEIVSENLSTLMLKKYGSEHQMQLSRDSGVAQATIGRILKQETSARVDTLEQLAKSFGVEPWELMAPGLGKDIVRDSSGPTFLEEWERLPEAFRLIVHKKAENLIEYWKSLPSFLRDSIHAPPSDKYYQWELSVEADMRDRLKLAGQPEIKTGDYQGKERRRYQLPKSIGYDGIAEPDDDTNKEAK